MYHSDTATTLDIARARRDTRACDAIIYFNNAGAALMPIPVADCLHAYLHQEEQIGGYGTAQAEQAQLDHFYSTPRPPGSSVVMPMR